MFTFLCKFLDRIGRERLGQPFSIMIWIYYYILNGIRSDLGLDNAFGMRNYLTLLQTIFTFRFSYTKHSLTLEN